MIIAIGGPWRFNNALIVTKKSCGLGEIRNLKLNEAAFWVLHNLPVYCMNKKIAYVDESCHCVGKYIRVRIRVDVSKLLKRAVKLNSSLAEKLIPPFLRYQKLPEFCHVCGFMGRSRCDCLLASPEEKLAANLDPKFKLLRAPSPPRRRTQFYNSYRSPLSFETHPSQPKSPKFANPSFSQTFHNTSNSPMGPSPIPVPTPPKGFDDPSPKTVSSATSAHVGSFNPTPTSSIFIKHTAVTLYPPYSSPKNPSHNLQLPFSPSPLPTSDRSLKLSNNKRGRPSKSSIPMDFKNGSEFFEEK